MYASLWKQFRLLLKIKILCINKIAEGVLILENLSKLLVGISGLNWKNITMIIIGLILIYLAIKRIRALYFFQSDSAQS